MHVYRDSRLFGITRKQCGHLVVVLLDGGSCRHRLEPAVNAIGHRVVNVLAPLILVCLLGAIALGF